MMNVFNLLKTGNYQAKVLKDFCEFKKGTDVHLELIHNDYVMVTTIDELYTEEFNLDTHADYDKYFKIY